MIIKKNGFFLLIFLIFLQSCSGGKIGNFLESSFNDLEKISQDEESQKNLEGKKVVIQKNKEINGKNNENKKKVEKPTSEIDRESKKVELQKNKEINGKNNEKRKEEEKSKFVLTNKKDNYVEKIQKQKNNKIMNSSKKRKIDLQSYKLILILKDVDPKDPTKDLSSILRNSEVNFEIEKVERILDSKTKSINKN